MARQSLTDRPGTKQASQARRASSRSSQRGRSGYAAAGQRRHTAEEGDCQGGAEDRAGEERRRRGAAGEKYKPLEQVKEEIRDALAQQKAREKILETMTPAARPVQRLRNGEDSLRPGPEDEPQSSAAQALGLEGHGPGQWDEPLYDGADLQVAGGRSGHRKIVRRRTNRFRQLRLPIGDFIPDESADRLRDRSAILAPDGSKLLPGNVYPLLEDRDQAEYTPRFDDQGDVTKVLQQWKQFEARKLATDEAERLAKKAREEKKSLKEALQGRRGDPGRGEQAL